jgi:hypothetical protein
MEFLWKEAQQLSNQGLSLNHRGGLRISKRPKVVNLYSLSQGRIRSLTLWNRVARLISIRQKKWMSVPLMIWLLTPMQKRYESEGKLRPCLMLRETWCHLKEMMRFNTKTKVSEEAVEALSRELTIILDERWSVLIYQLNKNLFQEGPTVYLSSKTKCLLTQQRWKQISTSMSRGVLLKRWALSQWPSSTMLGSKCIWRLNLV